MGFKADAGYGSSVKYIEEDLTCHFKNQLLYLILFSKKEQNLKSSDTIVSRSKQKIARILEKENIRPGYGKAGQTYGKESEGSRKDSTKKSLEIKDTQPDC